MYKPPATTTPMLHSIGIPPPTGECRCVCLSVAVPIVVGLSDHIAIAVTERLGRVGIFFIDVGDVADMPVRPSDIAAARMVGIGIAATRTGIWIANETSEIASIVSNDVDQRDHFGWLADSKAFRPGVPAKGGGFLAVVEVGSEIPPVITVAAVVEVFYTLWISQEFRIV